MTAAGGPDRAEGNAPTMTATEAKRPERTAPFAGGAIAKRWLRLVRRRPVLALVLAGLVLTVPGLTSLPPLDRDESRYAQATAQMLESGNFIEIRFQDEARNKKPVGIYWLQSLAVAALSEPSARQIWAYRVPSLIGALAAVLFAFWGGRRLFGDGVALLGACWLAACLLVAAEATIAKTDAVLLACVTAMQMAMARI